MNYMKRIKRSSVACLFPDVDVRETSGRRFIKDPTSKKISPNSESNSDSGRGQSSEEGGTGNNGDAVLS